MTHDDARYDAALAAAIRIIEHLQTNPHATTPEWLSAVTFAVLQAVYDTERLARRSLIPAPIERIIAMHEGQPIDPATHIYCMRLAYRLVGIIHATLRPEEVHDAATEFYKAIRDEHRHYETERQAKRA